MSIMDRIIYWLAYSTVNVIRVLPLSVCFSVGQALGAIAWAILPRYRRLARENMARAFAGEHSDAEIRRKVFEHFITTGANFLSALKIPTFSEAQIRACSYVENEDVILSCVRQRKGVVIAISHIGNWELFAQLNFLIPGVPTGTVYQSLRNKWLDNLINENRRIRGVATFDRRKGFAEPVAMLRQGGLVGVLVDQNAGDSGVWTPFFRRLASTSPLTATLACRTGAAVVPVAIFTEGFARWRISIHPPISYNAQNPNQLTADINTALESQVRESPKDWFWIHNRWKMPEPRILLSQEKRGTYLPHGDKKQLNPFRILIRSSNWLGDAVMSVPTVQALKQGRVDAKVSVLVPEKLAELWRTVPEVDEVLTISGKELPWDVAQKLRGRFDAAVLFPNSLRCALEVFLAGIPRRIGYRGHHRIWLLNQIIREPKKKGILTPQHHAERYAHIAMELGAPTPQFQPLCSPTALISTDLGLCPGAEYGPAKRWLENRFRTVIEEIFEQTGRRWKIFGTAKDSVIAQKITSGLSENIVVDRTGKTNLADLISELSSVRLLLTNDTGTMHLAALFGVPVVALFGSTEPLLTSPFGTGHHVIRRHVECSPCFLRTCPIDLRCMKEISTQQVKEALLEILEADPIGDEKLL